MKIDKFIWISLGAFLLLMSAVVREVVVAQTTPDGDPCCQPRKDPVGPPQPKTPDGTGESCTRWDGSSMRPDLDDTCPSGWGMFQILMEGEEVGYQQMYKKWEESKCPGVQCSTLIEYVFEDKPDLGKFCHSPGTEEDGPLGERVNCMDNPPPNPPDPPPDEPPPWDGSF